MNDHLPDCDINDRNPEGIQKPCNCAPYRHGNVPDKPIPISNPTFYPQPIQPSTYFKPLFDHMYEEHGLTLTDSELAEIVAVAKSLERQTEKKYRMLEAGDLIDEETEFLVNGTWIKSTSAIIGRRWNSHNNIKARQPIKS